MPAIRSVTGANVQQAVPLFGVQDIESSARFYVDGLGFTLTNKWVDEGRLRWCWLALGDAAVMLQEFWKEGPHRNLPDTPVGVGISINFICKDGRLGRQGGYGRQLLGYGVSMLSITRCA